MTIFLSSVFNFWCYLPSEAAANAAAMVNFFGWQARFTMPPCPFEQKQDLKIGTNNDKPY